jgi:hypothetical protein
MHGVRMALVHWCTVVIVSDALECVIEIDANDTVTVKDDADAGQAATVSVCFGDVVRCPR